MQDDFPYDLAIVLAAAALVIGFAVLQFRLVSRAQGSLRWLAAAPSLIIAAFVVANVISPSNIWPIALVSWLAIAFAVHFAVWLILRLVGRA
jgi:hypothetical protein